MTSRHALIATLVLLSASPAFAQATRSASDEQKITIGASYSTLTIYGDGDSVTLPKGWLFSVAGRVARNVAIVGEIGGNYKTESILGSDLKSSVHAYLGGVRFLTEPNPSVTPFAQVLVGAARWADSYLTYDESDTEFAFVPGGGVDIRITDLIALRVQGDLPFVFSEGETTNAFRFAIGIAFRPR